MKWSVLHFYPCPASLTSTRRPGVRCPRLSAICPIHTSSAQKNKATSYHLGQLKAKLAKLKRELISGPGGGGGGGSGIGFDVARQVLTDAMAVFYSPRCRTGIASVGFVGFPSVGKVWMGRSCCLTVLNRISQL